MSEAIYWIGFVWTVGWPVAYISTAFTDNPIRGLAVYTGVNVVFFALMAVYILADFVGTFVSGALS